MGTIFLESVSWVDCSSEKLRQYFNFCRGEVLLPQQLDSEIFMLSLELCSYIAFIGQRHDLSHQELMEWETPRSTYLPHAIIEPGHAIADGVIVNGPSEEVNYIHDTGL